MAVLRRTLPNRKMEPGEGLEPPTRALRKRCSLSHLAPRHPDAPHFISEIHPGHPPAPSLGSPSADNLVGKWSATSTREVTPARRCLDQIRPAVLEYNPHVPPTSLRAYRGDDRYKSSDLIKSRPQPRPWRKRSGTIR